MLDDKSKPNSARSTYRYILESRHVVEGTLIYREKARLWFDGIKADPIYVSVWPSHYYFVLVPMCVLVCKTSVYMGKILAVQYNELSTITKI